jgi:hypothetical protein
MSDLRELTDAELDIVGGGLTKPTRPEPSQGCGGEIKLVEEIIVDILKLLGGNNRPQNPRMA